MYVKVALLNQSNSEKSPVKGGSIRFRVIARHLKSRVAILGSGY